MRIKTPIRLEKRDGAVVAVPEGAVPTLTTDLVRGTIEGVRRCATLLSAD